MEYMRLPHGSENECLGVLSLGMDGILNCSDDEIEQIIRTAIDNGIHFFDLCAGGKTYMSPLAAPSPVSGKRCFKK